DYTFPPKIILLSDQGSNLIGQLMRQLYELLGISHIKTLVYHPEANGLVERFNGTLKHMLKKFVANQIDNWDKYLPVHAIKTWVRKESLPKDAISYVLEALRRLSQMQSIVHENTKKSQVKQKKLYDQKSSHRKFQIGDKVLVLLPTPGSKLESKWQGPYTVTNVCTNGLNYELDREKGRKQKRTYHINLLRLWKTREEMKLSTTEKECLAIVWAVETFRYYLFGRKFILQTDHNPLVWLNQVKNKNRKLLRWSLTLQEYDIELEHKCGEKHVNVDAFQGKFRFDLPLRISEEITGRNNSPKDATLTMGVLSSTRFHANSRFSTLINSHANSRFSTLMQTLTSQLSFSQNIRSRRVDERGESYEYMNMGKNLPDYEELDLSKREVDHYQKL
ncbi:Retrovirus-related Pol poly from transposon, partial [Paramuricea clavata]